VNVSDIWNYKTNLSSAKIWVFTSATSEFLTQMPLLSQGILTSFWLFRLLQLIFSFPGLFCWHFRHVLYAIYFNVLRICLYLCLANERGGGIILISTDFTSRTPGPRGVCAIWVASQLEAHWNEIRGGRKSVSSVAEAFWHFINF